MAVVHPKGSDDKTRQLVKRMSKKDLEVFQIDIAKIDLKQWHVQKSAMFRSQCTQVKGITTGKIAVKL